MIQISMKEYETYRRKSRLLDEIAVNLKDLLSRKSDTQGAYLARVQKTIQDILRSIKTL